MQICNPTEKIHRVKSDRTTQGSRRANDSGLGSPERLTTLIITEMKREDR